MSVAAILRRKGTHVDTASPNTTLAAVAKTMVVQGVGSLVIRDEGTGRLEDIELEVGVLRDYARARA